MSSLAFASNRSGPGRRESGFEQFASFSVSKKGPEDYICREYLVLDSRIFHQNPKPLKIVPELRGKPKFESSRVKDIDDPSDVENMIEDPDEMFLTEVPLLLLLEPKIAEDEIIVPPNSERIPANFALMDLSEVSLHQPAENTLSGNSFIHEPVPEKQGRHEDLHVESDPESVESDDLFSEADKILFEDDLWKFKPGLSGNF